VVRRRRCGDYQFLEQVRDQAIGSGNGRVRLAGNHFLRPQIDHLFVYGNRAIAAGSEAGVFGAEKHSMPVKHQNQFLCVVAARDGGIHKRVPLFPSDGQAGVRRAKPACCRGCKSPTGKEVANPS
jgi:hypothetical protein